MSIIKKYNDFMGGSNIRRFMNHMVVEGTTKSWFFGKVKSFEIHIYYTPVKKTIVEVKFYSDDGLDLESIKPEFKSGDNIEIAKKWIEKNNYQIRFDLSRLD
jgi:hypothetical protein